MNLQPHQLLLRKFSKLSDQIKKEFRARGFVIPTTAKNGDVRIDNYFIRYGQDGFYSIFDHNGYVIIEKINLPQTALLLANGVALGKFLDYKLVSLDQAYGYAAFEEQLTKKYAENNRYRDIDKLCLMRAKQQAATVKKEINKREIMKQFEKLKKFL
jgi:hypothetical protein